MVYSRVRAQIDDLQCNMGDIQQQRGQIQDELQNVTQALLELAVITHGFDDSYSADLITTRINQLVTNYQTLSKLETDITVPIDIVSYIEDGRNPDVYTREFVELLQRQNDYMNGKFVAMRRFRDILAEKIKETWPEMGGDVDVILAAVSSS